VTAALPAGATGLLGRNGAGKTSILKALLGLVPPTAGQLRVFGLDPAGRGGDAIRRRVGYMPERDCHIFGLNGFETVRLAAQLTGVPPLDAARRAHEVLYLVGLEEQRYRPVAGYSAGMRQKVKLATALVHDPELLFLDEPTNGLDPRGRVEMLRLIRSLAQDLGKSVVLSSHILHDVESICSHVVLLERGRLLASGPLAELTRNALRVFVLDATAVDGPALQARLEAHGVRAVEPGPDARFRLSVGDGFETTWVFAAVRDLGGAVHGLVEHRRTLVVVFLGAGHGAALGER
jgi:ABC-2 type transport system ATP-binding protein